MTIETIEGSLLGKKVLDKANNIEGKVVSFFYGEKEPKHEYADPEFFQTQEVLEDDDGIIVIRPDYLVVETDLGTHLAAIEDLEEVKQ